MLLTASPGLVLTFALPFSPHDCTLIMNQLTLQQLLEAHFLRLRGFQAWGVLLANLVQYNQHYTWNGLIYLLVMAPASLLRKQVLTNLFCCDRICILPTPAISLRQ